MKRNHKCAGQWTRKVEVDVSSSVVGNITLLNDALLLKLLVCELVRTQDLLLLLLPSSSLALTADVVKVVLVSLKLTNQIRVVVADRLVDLFKLLRLNKHTFLERAEMLQLLLYLVPQKA